MYKINCKAIRGLINSSVNDDMKPLSTYRLSVTLGVAEGVLTRMSNDDTYNPGVLTIAKLSEYFNVRIDDLLIKD